LRGSQRPDVSLAQKAPRILLYYARLIVYAARAKPKIFHILWNNKSRVFDRTLLMLYYRLLGKKIVFTAHNVNEGKRDATDSMLNRLSLRIQYQLADNICVHTDQMKRELQNDFGVREGAITVIPFGINNTVPRTDLTPAQAKRRLGIGSADRTVLVFGRIGPYKGLDLLVAAFQRIAAANLSYRLIIVGRPKKGAEKYWKNINQPIHRDIPCRRVI
jgi:D-inositol-3-phosphate glycosyltransferase